MIWQPYTVHIVASLPAYCVGGHAIWCTRAPLIFFKIVEWNLPYRVMRQFGLQQDIPVDFNTSEDLHDTDLRGRGRGDPCDWSQHHHVFIALWGSWRDHVITANALQGSIQYDHPYMVWFRTITCRFIVAAPERLLEFGPEPVGVTLEILVN